MATQEQIDKALARAKEAEQRGIRLADLSFEINQTIHKLFHNVSNKRYYYNNLNNQKCGKCGRRARPGYKSCVMHSKGLRRPNGDPKRVRKRRNNSDNHVDTKTSVR